MPPNDCYIIIVYANFQNMLMKKKIIFLNFMTNKKTAQKFEQFS
jgi:hypothetical protein